MVFVLECCEIRDQFNVIYGIEVLVKFELLKVVYRVVRKIFVKKREENSLIRVCVRDFVLVLRYLIDRGDIRNEVIFLLDIIFENFDVFVDGWKDIIEGNERVLILVVQRQIVQLRIYIELGCLLEILFFLGSENIDELYNILKFVLERKFLNVDMVLVFILIFFYVWNERRVNSLFKGVFVRLILKYRGIFEVSGFILSFERFGIVKVEDDENDDFFFVNYFFDVLVLQCLIFDFFGGNKEVEI